MHLNIRKETPADYPSIFQLVQSAFENAEHTDHDEQYLVERLRKSPAYIPELSLVAEVGGKIVGHIMFTTLQVGTNNALALAPLSVVPEMQAKGIGAALIKAGHQIAQKRGYTFSILLGHAHYYPRFGYLPANTFGIQSPFAVPEENFMACKLQKTPSRLDGMVTYPREFFEK